MYEIKQKKFEVSGFKIAYTDMGAEYGRVLFCVHGLLSNARDYDFLALELAEKGYRIISIDLPGRGKSDRLDDPSLYAPPSYIHFCHALINHVTAGKPFDYFGVSLGGMLGMALSSLSDIKMERLILVDVGAEISGDALNMVAQIAKVPPVYNSIDAAKQALRRRCASWGINEPYIWEHLEKYNIVENKQGMFAFHYDPAIGSALPAINETIQMWDLWRQIKQPTLLIRGGLSMLLTVETAMKMRDNYKGKSFDLITFNPCGHVPNMMQKDHIEALSSWLGVANKK